MAPPFSCAALQDELSGADIKAMCTEAGLLALRERRMRVTQVDFKKAKEKVRWAGFGGWVCTCGTLVGSKQARRELHCGAVCLAISCFESPRDKLVYIEVHQRPYRYDYRRGAM